MQRRAPIVLAHVASATLTLVNLLGLGALLYIQGLSKEVGGISKASEVVAIVVITLCVFLSYVYFKLDVHWLFKWAGFISVVSLIYVFTQTI